jgi:hypothetical protein
MGTGKINTSTQTKIKKPALCSICKRVPRADCDWNQGRCPHVPSMLDRIMSSPYKTRFYNLLKFITRKK